MTSDAVTEHRAASPPVISCFVVTMSDTRNTDTDTSGRTIVELRRSELPAPGVA